VDAFAVTVGAEVVVFTLGTLVAKASNLATAAVTSDTDVKAVI
jgi:hypothetical protein